MRGVMPSAAHFALLTLPETGRATGRCSQCESTTAEQATEYFSGGGAAQKARPAPGSRWSACETEKSKGNRYLGNNSVSWPKSPIQECVVYRQFIGKRGDSQEAHAKLIHSAPKTISVVLL